MISTDRPIKILAITDYLGRKNVNPIRPEAAQIIAMQRSGKAEFTILCSPESALVGYYQDRGIRVIAHKISKKISLKSIRFIRAQIKNDGYQIIHLYHSRAISNGATAAIGLPVKVVAYRGQTGSIKWYDPTSYLNVLHPRIDKIICVAQAVNDDLRRHLGANKDKLVTVYKGHDLSWYQDPPADLSALDLPAGAFTVSLVANLRARKGLNVLMAATHFFADEADIHILLVGAKADDPKVQKLITTAARPERIHPLGYRDDAPAVSGASDLSVLPTTKREGLSRAILEAMAYGRPAVVTNTGGNAELVEDGVSGYVVPPNDAKALADAIIRLSSSPDDCKKFGIEARRRIETHFNVEQGVEKTLRVYEELVSS